MNQKRKLSFGVCPQSLVRSALAMLFNHVSPDDATLTEIISDELKTSEPFAGLFVAREGSCVRSVIWARVVPGRLCQLTLPSESCSSLEIEGTLCALADDFMICSQCKLAMATITDGRTDRLENWGFSRLAELEGHVFCFGVQPPFSVDWRNQPRRCETLTFHAVQDNDMALLNQVMSVTFQETRDCAALNELRNVEETLETHLYESLGMKRGWYFVQFESRVVGCVLLSENDQRAQLAFIGIEPRLRGRGHGRTLVEFALSWGFDNGAKSMVVYNDIENSSAARAYLACGFVTFDRQALFAKQILKQA